jgi:CheY-like chemotaxis protein
MEPLGKRNDPRTAGGRRVERILLVDDNARSVERPAQILDLQGYQIQVANDGLDALDEARRLLPDLILLDIGLPGLDGVTLAHTLRAAPWFDGTSVWAMSARPSEVLARDLASGLFDDHLVKPLELDYLHVILDGFERAQRRK